MPCLGPLFRVELLRLSRKGSQFSHRIVLAFAALVILFFIYSNWFPHYDLSRPFESPENVTLAQSARFAEEFVFYVLLVQMFAIVVLTPVAVAGSVTEEVERGTIEQLLATELTGREIVLGKLFARLVFVGTVVLTGLPIVALSLLFGGVSMSALIQSYAVLLATLYLLGCFTMNLALDKGGLTGTLTAVYVYLVAFTIFSGCVSAFVDGTNQAGMRLDLPCPASPLHLLLLFRRDPDQMVLSTVILVTGYLVVGTLLALGASATLRRKVLTRKNRAVDSLENFARIATERGGAIRPDPDLVIVGRDEIPPLPEGFGYRVGIVERIDDENPLLWKERNVGGGSFLASIFHGGSFSEAALGCFFALLAVVVTFFSLSVLVALLTNGSRESVNGFVRVAGFLVLAIWVVGIGLKGATSVTSERDRDTLVSLLMIPFERHEILAAKWKAAWMRWGALRYCLGGVLVIGLLFRGLSPLYVPMAAGFAATMLYLSTSLSVWLSASCRGGTRATFAFFAIWLLILVGPYLLGYFAPPIYRLLSLGELADADIRWFCESLSPVEAWNNLNRPLGDGRLPHESLREHFPLRVVAAMLSGGLASLSGSVCWWLACRRFDREGRER